MICPFCGKLNRPGVLLCEFCGRLMLTLSPQSLFKTELLHSKLLSAPAPLTYPRPGTGFLHQTKQIVLELLGKDQRVCVSTQGHITLGRADESAGWQPTIDLTPYGAGEGGVSRMHADLYFENDQAFVLELGSSNGTKLNGRSVLVGTAQQLHDGDEMELGHLRMQLFFR